MKSNSFNDKDAIKVVETRELLSPVDRPDSDVGESKQDKINQDKKLTIVDILPEDQDDTSEEEEFRLFLSTQTIYDKEDQQTVSKFRSFIKKVPSYHCYCGVEVHAGEIVCDKCKDLGREAQKTLDHYHKMHQAVEKTKKVCNAKHLRWRYSTDLIRAKEKGIDTNKCDVWFVANGKPIKHIEELIEGYRTGRIISHLTYFRVRGGMQEGGLKYGKKKNKDNTMKTAFINKLVENGLQHYKSNNNVVMGIHAQSNNLNKRVLQDCYQGLVPRFYQDPFYVYNELCTWLETYWNHAMMKKCTGGEKVVQYNSLIHPKPPNAVQQSWNGHCKPDFSNIYNQFSYFVPQISPFNYELDYMYTTDDTLLTTTLHWQTSAGYTTQTFKGYPVINYEMGTFVSKTFDENAQKDIRFMEYTLISRNVRLPNGVLEMARQLMSGRTFSNYSLNSFKRDFVQLWQSTVLKYVIPYDVKYAVLIYSYLQRIDIELTREMTYENLDVLQSTRDIQQKMNNPGDKDPEKTLLNGFLEWVLPTPVAKWLKEKIEYVLKNFTLFDTLKRWFIVVFQNLNGSLGNLFAAMKVFPELSNLSNAVVEEIIRTVPFGSTTLCLAEIYKDYQQHKSRQTNLIDFFMRMGTRVVFHSLFGVLKLFSFPVYLATLPIRIWFHKKYDDWVDKCNSVDGQLQGTLDEIKETVGFVCDLPQPLRLHVLELKNFTTSEIAPREGVIVKMPFPERNVVPMETRKIYPMAMPLVRQCLPGNTVEVYVNAVLKRQYQPYTIKDIPEKQKVEFMDVVDHWSNNLEQCYVTREEWIHKENNQKAKLYENAAKIYDTTLEIDYSWTLQLKLDEVLYKRSARTIFAPSLSYLVNVAPMIYAYQKSLKNLLNGETNVGTLNTPIYILYCSGVTREQICKFLDKSIEDPNSFYVLILGDDSSIVKFNDELGMDMSRFDSTQLPFFTIMFDKLLSKNAKYKDEMDIFRKGQNAQIYMRHPESGEKIKMPDNYGMKTGCPETSNRNSTLMAIAIICAIIDDPINWKINVPNYLKLLGWLPKPHVHSIYDGFEFCKTIYFRDLNRYKALPLLSIFSKFKTLTPHDQIVPWGKIFSSSYNAITTLKFFIQSTMDPVNTPFFNELYLWLKDRTLHNTPTHDVFTNPYKVSGNIMRPVSKKRALDIWCNRYDCDTFSVQNLFQTIRQELTTFPFIFSSDLVMQAVKVDYGIE